MKKIICFVMSVAMLLTASCAGAIESITWEKYYYVDEFNDPTEEWYLTTFGAGTFSNSVTMNSDLSCRIMVDVNSISFQLFEYGDLIVRNDSLFDEDDVVYTIKVKDQNGKVNEIEGFMPHGGDRIFIYEKNRPQLARIFQENSVVKFSITPTNKSIPKYVFTINAYGFLDLYLDATVHKKNDVTFTTRTEHYIQYTVQSKGSVINSEAHYVNTYDENGLLIRRETISDKFPATETFTYENGVLRSSREEGISGRSKNTIIEKRVIERLYNEHGDIISERYSIHDIEKNSFKYNGYDYTYQYGEKGEILREISVYLTFDGNGNVTKKGNPSEYTYVYEWNADGTVSQKMQTNVKNSSVTVIDYTYDEYGKLIHEYREPKAPTGSYWFTSERIFEYK